MAIDSWNAGVIWFVGIKLSDNTDVLAERLHLGSALGGLILLAIATNLPEIAITASAAVAGQLDVVVGNILGGMAVQTVVLVVLDAAGVRPRVPLTRLAASLVLVLEGALVVVVLAVVVMGTQLPRDLIVARLAPASVLIAALWVVGLVLLNRAGKGLPWHEGGDAPDTQPEPRGQLPWQERARGDREGDEHDQGRAGLRGFGGRDAGRRSGHRAQRRGVLRTPGAEQGHLWGRPCWPLPRRCPS